MPARSSRNAIHEACASQRTRSFPAAAAAARIATAAGFPHPGISQTGVVDDPI